MTAQELYNQFKSGYRYANSYGHVFNYMCNTCGVEGNVPPGFTTSRPAGGSNVAYAGYGISTDSLDAAWDKYISVMNSATAPASTVNPPGTPAGLTAATQPFPVSSILIGLILAIVLYLMFRK